MPLSSDVAGVRNTADPLTVHFVRGWEPASPPKPQYAVATLSAQSFVVLMGGVREKVTNVPLIFPFDRVTGLAPRYRRVHLLGAAVRRPCTITRTGYDSLLLSASSFCDITDSQKKETASYTLLLFMDEGMVGQLYPLENIRQGVGGGVSVSGEHLCHTEPKPAVLSFYSLRQDRLDDLGDHTAK